MEQTPAAPQTRRRWPIVVVVAVLVLALWAGFWWSMRPTLDPGLVGMWRLQRLRSTLRTEWTFGAEGQLATVGYRDAVAIPGPLMQWKIEDGLLSVWQREDSDVTAKYHIVRADQDELVLQPIDERAPPLIFSRAVATE